MSLYEPLLRHVLWPAYEGGLRRRETPRHLRSYAETQWLSADALRELQFRRLKKLLAWCQREVPFYRDRWAQMGLSVEDIRTPADVALLPVLTKADIRSAGDALKAASLKDTLAYKATGGSTGEPLRFGYTRESNDRRVAVMWRGYGWAGSRMGRRTLFLWGGAVGSPTAAHQFKDKVYNAVFARKVLNSFAMTEANLSSYADAVEAYRPEVIVSYVGPLVRLAQFLVDTGRHLSHRPVSIIGAAEALHPFQRELIERAFGAPVYNTYGCREFMLIASECEHRDGLHVNADHLMVETLSADGQPCTHGSGEVAITDLFNYGMPFIRYVNGDMATPFHGLCACGRGLPLLASVDGRKLDAIRTPAGHVLPGEFFPHMLKDVPGLTRFQLVQRTIDRLDLSIVRGEAFNDASLAYIQREVAKVLGDSAQLHCHFVDDIPLTRSGKLRVTVSELDS
ncbi:phenylacetate--CoA ligase family protein [Luteibacter aegosomaticola]|uniref:phenylacetate--CoA ligase family protein n=1 Tax=Luteibacter aegosomaticola TaxID=2911538 RepID=UPI001FF71AEE|nr:phenylacetate--CoA ligase family protein [Luteibacter aegosomaticola]UPG92078.1 phenylacetate--CoA ligase family protein [Luteibacter aegosomaticola]